MIRNVVIHLAGKLPVLADLRAVPAPNDVTVLCTNLRTRDGKRPSYIEDGGAWFLLPMHEVTIIELPADALETAAATTADEPIQLPSGPMAEPADELDTAPLETDEELLARIRQL